MSKPKEIDAETIRRVMGHVGSIVTKKKSKSSSVNLAKARLVWTDKRVEAVKANLKKAREKRWPKKEVEK